MFGCEVERVGPATPGSASAEGAALAAEIVVITERIRDNAQAIQAAADPEAMAGGAPGPVPAVLEAELSSLRENRDLLESRLSAMEESADRPVE